MRVNIGGIVAGVAFILSFLIGLIGQASFPAILIRAFLFAGIFFALFLVIQIVGKKFLSNFEFVKESGEEESEPPPGSRVDISVEDDASTDQAEDVSSEDESDKTNTTEPAEASKQDVFTPVSPVDDNFSDMSVFEESPPVPKRPARKMDEKALQALGKQLDPVKMAGAIQTVLRRE
jgi:cytoskeletal protein RodZ